MGGIRMGWGSRIDRRRIYGEWKKTGWVRESEWGWRAGVCVCVCVCLGVLLRSWVCVGTLTVGVALCEGEGRRGALSLTHTIALCV